MKILILANNDIGLYKFRKELIEELIKANKVYICLPVGEFIEPLEKLGCEFVPCTLLDRRGTNPLKDLELLRFYKQLIKQINPDAVLTYTIKPNVYGGIACASLKVPYIANITGLGTAVENGGILQKIALMLYRYGLRRAKKVFFQNAENQMFFVDHRIVTDKYELLPGSGVNLETFSVIEYPSEDTIEFAFISRIMRQKGINQYLEAAQYIKAKYPHTIFHVCGFCEENYIDKLKNLSADDTIIYHGMINDVREILKSVHCTVHPTYYPEGLSNVLLESCACARPIITTNRSGCREVVEDEVNGLIVREKDSGDLIEIIEKFLAISYEGRKKMGLLGRAKVEKEFDRKIVVKKYLKEINSL